MVTSTIYLTKSDELNEMFTKCLPNCTRLRFEEYNENNAEVLLNHDYALS